MLSAGQRVRVQTDVSSITGNFKLGQGRVVTVSEIFSNSYIRVTDQSGIYSISAFVPASHKPSIEVGNVVRPIQKGLTHSVDYARSVIEFQELTVHHLNGSQLSFVEIAGTFWTADFEVVEGSTNKPAHQNHTSLAEPVATGTRKAIRKSWQKRLGVPLKWYEGHLHYEASGAKVSGSPYKPKFRETASPGRKNGKRR